MEDSNRRARRSTDPNEATQLQLKQVIEDFGLENCVLVDADGQVAASAVSPTASVVEWARKFPALFEGGRRPVENEMSACEFRAAGRRMFVATVGSQGVMRDVALYRAILGVRRIFG